MKIRKKPHVRTLPWQLFDGIFKRLMYLSSGAIVQFINALFGTNYPTPVSCSTQTPKPSTVKSRNASRISSFGSSPSMGNTIISRKIYLQSADTMLVEIHDEARVWFTKSNDIPGLILGSNSVETLPEPNQD
jgi:hypothetical protein